MKKIFLVLVAAVLVVAGIGVWRMFSEATASAGAEVSQKAAQELQAKIDAVQKASEIPDRKSEQVEVTEIELESFVLFSMKEDIPARLDTFDVQLNPGTVAADTQITFTSNGTGNPVIDSLIGGTHNLFVRGKMSAVDRVGRFELEQVRVDGIPVPNILIETLINRYVKPKYPEVDLNTPFEMPWGIDALTISDGKATIVY